MRRIADRFDLVTLAQKQVEPRFRLGPGRVMVLHSGIDLSCFPAVESSSFVEIAHKPRLTVHTDWSCDPSGRLFEWFERRVWPSIHRQFPETELRRTGPGITSDVITTLRDASVVVAPASRPELARLPVLQAMAMQRPVITSSPTGRALGASHGEHLLLTRHEQDWVDHCLESLRCASMRLDLARRGRAFVENHCPIHRTGAGLMKFLLAGPARSPGAIARAA